MRGRDAAGAFYPQPSRIIQFAGILGVLGALLWPITLVVLASVASNCSATNCTVERGGLFLVALGPVCIGLTVLALELRVRHTPGLGDLVGDLSIATASVLFILAFLTGSIGLVGPGLLLLLIGSLIFGTVGYLNGTRQRLASATLAIASGTTLLLLFAGGLGTTEPRLRLRPWWRCCSSAWAGHGLAAICCSPDRCRFRRRTTVAADATPHAPAAVQMNGASTSIARSISASVL